MYVYTTIALGVVGVASLLAAFYAKADRQNAAPDEDALQRQSRDDLRSIVFLLCGLIVMIGIGVDGLRPMK
jgi:hypothetical protein